MYLQGIISGVFIFKLFAYRDVSLDNIQVALLDRDRQKKGTAASQCPSHYPSSEGDQPV